MPYGITQIYLPPGRGSIPALTPAVVTAGTRFIHKLRMKDWVDLSRWRQTTCPESLQKFGYTRCHRVSWLSWPSAPLGTVGVNNLPTVVTQWPASAGFEPMSFKHQANALSIMHSSTTPLATYLTATRTHVDHPVRVGIPATWPKWHPAGIPSQWKLV